MFLSWVRKCDEPNELYLCILNLPGMGCGCYSSNFYFCNVIVNTLLLDTHFHLMSYQL